MNQPPNEHVVEMDAVTRHRLRDYAWKYFEFHADQRMKTFYFFLLISGSIIAGFVSKAGSQNDVASVLGFLLTFICAVFEKLERRNRELVKAGEAALKRLDCYEGLQEVDGKPNPIRFFDYDDSTTNQFPKEPNILKASLSYTMVLRCVFGGLGILGLGAGLICLSPHLHCHH